MPHPFEQHTDFASPKKIEAMYEEAKGLIIPQLAAAIENRAGYKQLLGTFKAKLAQMQEKRAAAADELAAIRVDLDALAGGDPLKAGKQRKALESKIEEIDGAIKALEEAVQMAVEHGTGAQAGLYDIWMAAQAKYLPKVQGAFDRLHQELSELHVCYGLAIRRLYQEIMCQSDFAEFPLKHPRGVEPKPCTPLQVKRTSSVYTVNERLESPVLSAILR